MSFQELGPDLQGLRTTVLEHRCCKKKGLHLFTYSSQGQPTCTLYGQVHFLVLFLHLPITISWGEGSEHGRISSLLPPHCGPIDNLAPKWQFSSWASSSFCICFISGLPHGEKGLPLPMILLLIPLQLLLKGKKCMQGQANFMCCLDLIPWATILLKYSHKA